MLAVQRRQKTVISVSSGNPRFADGSRTTRSSDMPLSTGLDISRPQSDHSHPHSASAERSQSLTLNRTKSNWGCSNTKEQNTPKNGPRYSGFLQMAVPAAGGGARRGAAGGGAAGRGPRPGRAAY